MTEFLAHCDFQAAFGFLAFFSGIIAFIAFVAVDSGAYKDHTKSILRFAKIFLTIMLISLFFVALLPNQEEMAKLLLTK